MSPQKSSHKMKIEDFYETKVYLCINFGPIKFKYLNFWVFYG